MHCLLKAQKVMLFAIVQSTNSIFEKLLLAWDYSLLNYLSLTVFALNELYECNRKIKVFLKS